MAWEPEQGLAAPRGTVLCRAVTVLCRGDIQLPKQDAPKSFPL